MATNARAEQWEDRRVELRAEAERYCSLVERAESFERENVALALASALSDVLAAAARLPHVQPSEADLPGRPTFEDWERCFSALQRVLGDWNEYWSTLAAFVEYGPLDEADHEHAVAKGLVDDLADVWQDLKHGLVALDLGAGENDVTWEWRFGFYQHWGRHATEALRVLHARLAEAGGWLMSWPPS